MMLNGLNSDTTMQNSGTINNTVINTINSHPSMCSDKKPGENPSNRVWFEVPHGIQSFWGRVEFLQQLHEILTKNQSKSVPTILSQLKVVSGLGGIGKTQTALKYISQYGDSYENVIWIQAETETTLTNSFLRLADKLQIPTNDSKGKVRELSTIVENVYQELCAGEKSTLFVFDNADDFNSGVERSLPSSVIPELKNLVILVTSRNQDWSRQFEKFQVFSLDVFTPEETMNFILKQLDLQDGLEIREETREFIELIGGLPLALQQSLAFIKEKSFQTGKRPKISNYVVQFKSAMGKILDYNKIPGSPSTIFVTWNVTFEKIKTMANGESSIKILQVLAFLYADKVPVTIIQSIFPQLEELELFDCLILLEKYSLINRKLPESDEDMFVTIHRQLQFVIMQNLKDSQNLESVFNKVLDQCRGILNNINLAKSSDVFTNVHQLVENPFNFIPTTEKLLDFIHDFADVLFHAGRYYESLNLCTKVYNNRREILGENHEKTLISQQLRARRLAWLGKEDEALNLFQVILERTKTHLGLEHEATLETKHEIARLYYDQRKDSESARWFEELLREKIKVFGETHQSTLRTQHMLALVYSVQNKLLPALKMYEEVEVRRVEILGVDHPQTLATMQKKAIVLLKLGKVEDADDLFRHVHEKQKEILGEIHPATISTVDWISLMLEQEGKLEEALELRTQVLERFKNVLGESDPYARWAEEQVERLRQKIESHGELAQLLEPLSVVRLKEI